MTRRRPRPESPFARILNSLLLEKGMRVREAARIGGVSPSTITDWTSGTLPTNYIAVKKLADALGVSFCFLLTGIVETANDRLSQKPKGGESHQSGNEGADEQISSADAFIPEAKVENTEAGGIGSVRNDG